MYNSGTQSAKTTEKNPNRVAGGLRAQGQDTYTMLDEDGYEKQIPTQRYVQTLEERVRAVDDELRRLRRKQTQHEANVQRLSSLVDRLRR